MYTHVHTGTSSQGVHWESLAPDYLEVPQLIQNGSSHAVKDFKNGGTVPEHRVRSKIHVKEWKGGTPGNSKKLE